MIRSWEVWALWLALLIGLGVLGHTAWSWQTTAAAPVVAAAPQENTPAPPARTLPWLDALAPLVSRDNANLASATAAATALAASAPQTLPSTGSALAQSAEPELNANAPAAALEAIKFLRPTGQADATLTSSAGASAAMLSPADIGLPVFPGALPVPERSAQSAEEGTMLTLTTRAPLAAVVNFYRQALPEGQRDTRSVVAGPAGPGALNLRETDTQLRTVRSVQVAEVGSTVYVRLSLTPLP